MSLIRTIALSASLLIATTTFAQSARPTPEQLTTDIRQRDSAERRAKAVADLRTMLASDPANQATALTAIAQTYDIKYDRTGLEDAVVPLLQSKNANVRRTALTALPNLKPSAAAVDKAAALAKDPDPQVRAAVMHSVAFIRGHNKIEAPVGEPALTLLGDSEKDVVVETARSLWGVPVTAEVEAKVIELSRFPADQDPGHKSIQYWMMYFVLSTRPQVSDPVAKRLPEIARHPKLDQNWTGRAVWGFNRPASPEAAEIIAKACIDELDNSLNPYNREWAVRGLINIKSEAATKKLTEIAKSSDEPEQIRELAAGAISH